MRDLLQAKDTVETFVKSGKLSNANYTVSWECPLCDWSLNYSMAAIYVPTEVRNEVLVKHIQAHYVDDWFKVVVDMHKEANGLRESLSQARDEVRRLKGVVERVRKALSWV
jgi:hypothetical protein